MDNWGVIDSETDPFEIIDGFDKDGNPRKQAKCDIAPFIWAYYNGSEKFVFHSTESLVNFLRPRKEIVYAHNGGKFDYTFLLDYIDDGEVLLINRRISKVHIGECELRDSMNILPINLGAYNKTKIDYGLMHKDVRHLHIKQITDYLIDDVVDLYNFVKVFIDKHGHEITLAGAAFKELKRTIPDKDCKMLRGGSGLRFRQQFSPFYFGGRVQCFEKGIIDHEFDMFDINSAYPFAMSHDLPWGFNYEYDTVIYNDRIKQGFFVVEGFSHGVFPERSKTGLHFPHKFGEFNVTGWELEAALETGGFDLENVLEAYYFKDSVNFSDFVAEKYEGKERYRGVDAGKYNLYKLELNSPYGKLAANSEHYEKFVMGRESQVVGMAKQGFDCEPLPSVGRMLYSRPLKENEMFFYNIATGSSITGFVRAMLIRAIHSCEKPLYCDTDSLAGVGIKIAVGNALGEWDKEGHALRGAIAGKKLYAFDLDSGKTKCASKGVRLSRDDIFKVAAGETVTYVKESPTFSIGGQKPIVRKVRMT